MVWTAVATIGEYLSPTRAEMAADPFGHWGLISRRGNLLAILQPERCSDVQQSLAISQSDICGQYCSPKTVRESFD